MKLYSITIFKVDQAAVKKHQQELQNKSQQQQQATNASSSSSSSSSERACSWIICSATDVSDFGILQRSGARQVLTFGSRLVAERTPAGSRMQLNHEGKSLYCQALASPSNENLAVAIVCDKEYKMTTAFNCCQQVLQSFCQSPANKQWQGVQKDNAVAWKDIDTLLKEWSDGSADKIAKINADLEQTKIVMAENIDKILSNSEKIDDLVAKSADLSDTSRIMYKQSSKLNSCC